MHANGQPCFVCGAPLPPEVARALDELRAPGPWPNLPGLALAVATVLEQPSGAEDRDAELFGRAVIMWCGAPPQALVAAMRHMVESDELFGQEWSPAFGHAVYVESLVRAADIAMDAAAKLC